MNSMDLFLERMKRQPASVDAQPVVQQQPAAQPNLIDQVDQELLKAQQVDAPKDTLKEDLILALGPTFLGAMFGGAGRAAAAPAQQAAYSISESIKKQKATEAASKQDAADKRIKVLQEMRKNASDEQKAKIDREMESVKSGIMAKEGGGFQLTPAKAKKEELENLKLEAEIGKTKAEAAKPKTMTDPELKAATELRKEYQSRPIVKEFDVIQNSFENIKSSAAAKNNPSADMALIYGYMKLLDPNTGIKEGEYATAQNAASIPDKIKNEYNKALTGNFLNEGQKQKYVKSAEAIFKNKSSQLERVQTEFGDISKRYKVDPNLIYQRYQDSPKKEAIQQPKMVIQNGVQYILNEQTGEYE